MKKKFIEPIIFDRNFFNFVVYRITDDRRITILERKDPYRNSHEKAILKPLSLTKLIWHAGKKVKITIFYINDSFKQEVHKFKS